MDGSQLGGRPLERWRDEINDSWRSVTWKQNAQEKWSWKNNAKAFIQQVDQQWLNMIITKGN